jgi:hypothetical protein
MALVGDICVDDAAGSCLMDEEASTTNPTLVPNRADPDTGIGWVSTGIYSLIAGGTQTMQASSSQILSQVPFYANSRSATSIASGIAGGFALADELASATNPTLIPNRSEVDTGLGWVSDTIHLIGGGISEAEIGVAGTIFNEGGLSRDFRVESEDNSEMIVVDGGDNTMGIGRSGFDYNLLTIGGTFVSGGASTETSTVKIGATLTSATGDTFVTQLQVGGSMTTQAASETITTVATLYLLEPTITVGSGDTITNSATLYIKSAATEATNDYALWVDAGKSRFDDAIMIGPTSTTYLLDVQKTGSGDFINFERTGGLGYLRIGFDSAETNISSGTSLNFDTNGGSQQFVLSSAGAVFNEDSGARDFRVEGTSSDHLLFIDSSNDSVSIGVNNVTPSPAANWPFGVWANDATGQTVIFDNDDVGLWALEFRTDAQGDAATIATWTTSMRDSGGAGMTATQIKHASVLDNAGAETGRVLIRASVAGSITDILDVTGALGDVGINVDGIIRVTDAAGPAMLNEVASSLNPTLIPNRSDPDTGIGWPVSDNVSIVAGGVLSGEFAETYVALYNFLDMNDSDGTGFIQLREQASSPSGVTNIGRLFVVDNGSGKSKLMVIFASGSAVQLAIEP